ncbi:MAG TPA: glyoxylate/hydroxypyruvate reductase A [Burkholderiales bacterium]|nr:glyoxylate/hydroxypyruvate reductase A [Burkholderiales bacterium]
MVILFQSDTDDPGPWRSALTRALSGIEFRVWPALGRVEEIDYALVWKPPPGMLASLPRLKAIVSLGAGVDHIFCDPQLPHGVPITRMLDAGLAAQMSEYALYGVLHFHRRMDRYAEQQRSGEWRQLPAVPPQQRTIGVLGLGVLGLDFARKAAALGFRVQGWSRSPRAIAGVETVHGPAGFEPFLARSEALVNFLPLTRETEGILNARSFARMPRGAFLINIARGAHLVEPDLLAALDSGQLGGAMLDVFAREPLSADHTFWRHPRILVTPHIAGLAIAELMVEQVVDNIRRIERGEALLGLVDPERGY